MSEAKMDFGRSYQLQILALLYQDFTFMQSVHSQLLPSAFDDYVLEWYFVTLRDYYMDYQMGMGKEALKEEVRRALSDSKTIKKKDRDDFKAVYKRIKKPVQDSDHIRSTVLTWIRRQAWKEFVIEAATVHIPKNDFETMEARIEGLESVGVDMKDIGTHYFQTYPDRVQRRQREWITISTGIPELDYVLRGNGLGRGHLGIWMAPSKRGKTMALIHNAKAAIIRGYKVVFYTLEMSEDEVADRFDSSWTNLTAQELDQDLRTLYKRLGKLNQRYGDSLIIKGYPTNSVTVSDLKNHLRQCAAMGFVPDLICVDYGAIMKPERHFDEKRHTVGSIYEGLKGLARELNACVWTAIQTNRKAFKKDTVKMDDSSESMEPIFICDLAISLSQTEAERQANAMRLYIAANRHGAMGFDIEINTRYSTAQFAVYQ